MTTKLKKLLHFKDGDTIVATRAENEAGPGWRNWPLWVYIQSRDGKIRCECLQPEEQPREVGILFNVAEAINSLMIRALMRGGR